MPAFLLAPAAWLASFVGGSAIAAMVMRSAVAIFVFASKGAIAAALVRVFIYALAVVSTSIILQLADANNIYGTIAGWLKNPSTAVNEAAGGIFGPKDALSWGWYFFGLCGLSTVLQLYLSAVVAVFWMRLFTLIK